MDSVIGLNIALSWLYIYIYIYKLEDMAKKANWNAKKRICYVHWVCVKTVYKKASATRGCVFFVCVCELGHDRLSDKKRGTIIRPSPTQSVGCVTARMCAAFPIEMRQNGGIQILIILFPSGGAKAAFQSEEDKKKTLSLSLSLTRALSPLTPWHEYLLGGGAQQMKTTSNYS